MVKNTMTVSRRGTQLVAKYEGCRLKAYRCPAGVWTIGYGHTENVHEGDVLPSEDKALELLKDDLAKYAAYVNHAVQSGNILFSLNQNQFDALTSFCYNCGAGNLAKLISNRTAEVISKKMLEYNKAGGTVLSGLTKRRKEESELFISPYPTVP